jgi:hypothetical protein
MAEPSGFQSPTKLALVRLGGRDVLQHQDGLDVAKALPVPLHLGASLPTWTSLSWPVAKGLPPW